MSTTAVAGAPAPHSIVARIDRLPSSRYLLGLVARISTGGWFEFYELFMPGFISIGLIGSNIYVLKGSSPFDPRGFASFLASFFLGMFVSTGIFGFVSDRFGRRAVFVQSMVVYSIAQLAIAFSNDAAFIDALRFIAGAAVGMQLVNNDSYISELVPRASRGRYLTLAYVFVLTAVPFAAFLASALVPHAPFGFAGWRWVVAIGAASGALVWFVQRGLPESPRWLEVHGKRAAAERVVAEIERRVEREGGVLATPVATAAEPEPARAAWREMFGPFYLGRTLMLSVFQFCQTIAVFGFTSFIPILLTREGFTIVHSLNYSFLIVLMTPVGAIVAAVLAERIERKWQLVISAALIGIAGIVFASARTVPLILVSGGLIALGNNWLIAIFHPYAAELFPTRFRASAVGFTFSWSRVGSIFVGYWTTGLLAAYGSNAVFFLIGASMIVIMLAVGIFGPRTNGRSLEALSP